MPFGTQPQAACRVQGQSCTPQATAVARQKRTRINVAVRPEWRTSPVPTTPSNQTHDVIETLQQQLQALNPGSTAPAPLRRRQHSVALQPKQAPHRKPQMTPQGILDLIYRSASESVTHELAMSAWEQLVHTPELTTRTVQHITTLNPTDTVRCLWSLGQICTNSLPSPPSPATRTALFLSDLLAPPLTHTLLLHIRSSSLTFLPNRFLLLSAALDSLDTISRIAASRTPPSPNPTTPHMPPTPSPSLSAPTSTPATTPSLSTTTPQTHPHPTPSPAAPVSSALPSKPQPQPTPPLPADSISSSAPPPTPQTSPITPRPDVIQLLTPSGAYRQLLDAVVADAALELKRPKLTDEAAGQLADLLEAIQRRCSSSGASRPGFQAISDALTIHLGQEHGKYSPGFGAAALRILGAADLLPAVALQGVAQAVAHAAVLQIASRHEQEQAANAQEATGLAQLLKAFLQAGLWPGESLLRAATCRLATHLPQMTPSLLATTLHNYSALGCSPGHTFLSAARRRSAQLSGSFSGEQVAVISSSVLKLTRSCS